MTRNLMITLVLNVVFVNAVLWLFEVALRSMMPSLHLAVTAFVIFLVLGAQLLLRRFDAPALLSIGIPSAFLLVWFAFAGMDAHGISSTILPILVGWAPISVPFVVMNRLLLPWAVRGGPSPKHAMTILAGCLAVSVLTVVFAFVYDRAERNRMQRAYEASLERERLRVQALRDSVAAGDRSKSCELFGSDARVKPAVFDTCRELVESVGDPNDCWKELGWFTQGSSFKSWSEEDRIDGGSFGNRQPVVPPHHQKWFVETYFQTWMRFDDAELVKTSPAVYGPLTMMDDRRSVTWTDDTYAAVRELAPKMQERLKAALAKIPADPLNQERTTAEALVRYFDGKL